MRRAVLFAAILFMAGLLAACGDYYLRARAAPHSVSPGGAGKIVVKFGARGKYHIDPEGMVKITFAPPSSIAMQKKALSQEDWGDDGAFSADFTVGKDAKKGAADVRANIMFQLCTEELCKLITEERVIKVKIK